MLKLIMGLAVAFQAVSANIAEIGRNKRSTAGSDPVADLHKTPDIIAYWNYTVLTYTVETPDKYLLTLFRIPYGISNASDACQSREPIILHHGLFSSSADWVSQDATNNLPMILAENCFDVWLANARGTSYSNKYKNLNSSTDEAYWQFSFDEMGKYDVPTIIDFVLNNSNNTVEGTKFEKLSWVGHSLGCTSFFIGLHYNPAYNGKVRKMVALAPAAFIQGMQSPPAVALANVPDPLTEVFFIATTKGSFFPEIANSFIYNYAPNFCPGDPTGMLCASILNFITGSSLSNKISAKTSGRVVTHTPETISVRTMTHLIQNLRTCQFANQTNNFENMVPVLGSELGPLLNTLPNQDVFLRPVSSFLSGYGRKRRSLLGGLLDPLLGTTDSTTAVPTTSAPSSNITCQPSVGYTRIQYDLGKTTLPVMLLYGESDTLVVPQSAEITAQKLGTPAGSKVVKKIGSYNHLDFMYADSSKALIFDPAVMFLSEGRQV